MRWIAPIIIGFLFAGCQTTARLNHRLAGWKGSTTSEVKSRFSEQFKVEQESSSKLAFTNKTTVLAYERSGYPRPEHEVTCMVEMAINNNSVSSATWEGSEDYCAEIIPMRGGLTRPRDYRP